MLAPGALVHPCPGDLGWGGPLAGRGWTATGWWTFTTGTGPGPMEADGGTAACRGGELDDEEDLRVAYTILRSHPQGPLEESPGCFTNQFFMKEFFRYVFWGWVWGSLGGIFSGYVGKIIEPWKMVPAGKHQHSHHQLRHENDLKNSSTSTELNAQHVQNSGV